MVKRSKATSALLSSTRQSIAQSNYQQLSHDIANVLENNALDPNDGKTLPLNYNDPSPTASKLLHVLCTADPAIYVHRPAHHSSHSTLNALQNTNPHSLAIHTLIHYILPAHPKSSASRLIRDMATHLAKNNVTEGVPDVVADGAPPVVDNKIGNNKIGTRYAAMMTSLFALCAAHDHATITALLLPNSPLLLNPKSLTSTLLHPFLPYPAAPPTPSNGQLPPTAAPHFLDPTFQTCLHIAAASPPPILHPYQSSLTISALINAGADSASQDNNGWTGTKTIHAPCDRARLFKHRLRNASCELQSAAHMGHAGETTFPHLQTMKDEPVAQQKQPEPPDHSVGTQNDTAELSPDHETVVYMDCSELGSIMD